MEINEIAVSGFEKVVRADEPRKGYSALIAVHDTTLGPALGGLRQWQYPDFDAALTDVLRLARGMTYKSAVARTGLGGGKSVLLRQPEREKSEDLLRWMGRFIDALGGTYITAEDVGTSVFDLDVIAQETRFVTGRAREVGGSGDPSPYTALGTFRAIQACAEERFGSEDLSGRRVLIQGLGHVGYWLARLLNEAGAKLSVYDLEAVRTERAREELGARVVPPEELWDEECDVFAPCALGAVLNAETIPRLRARIVCGAANNQLRELGDAEALRARDILYAPDYVVNAGGVINISVELSGAYDENRARDRVENIPAALREVFELARRRGITTAQAADELAESILEEARRLRSTSA